LSREEVMTSFNGAVMIIIIQLTMLYAVTQYIFIEQVPSFTLNPGSSFVIIIARFLSSLMMHLNNEPEIKQGI
jgi:hypothetical protein